MKTFALAAAAVLVLCGSLPAAAGPRHVPGVDYREHRQAVRIYRGVQDGSLSFRETGRLVRGEARIHRAERRAGADGVITAGERVRLHGRLNRQSRRIHAARHD